MAPLPVTALIDFGKLIGIPDLEFDEHGYCCLFIDDVTLNLEYDSETGHLLAYAHMGLLPDVPSMGMYEMLLEANFFCRDTAGATLGIDTATGAILLHCRVPADDLTGAQLETVVTQFVNAAEVWKKRIAEYRPDVPGLTGLDQQMMGKRI